MSKLRKSARGQECQIRIPGVCDCNPENTVLCHLSGGGMGAKVTDMHAAYGCAACHKVVDGEKSHHSIETIELWHHHAVIRTQLIMMAQGLITHSGVPRKHN